MPTENTRARDMLLKAECELADYCLGGLLGGTNAAGRAALAKLPALREKAEVLGQHVTALCGIATRITSPRLDGNENLDRLEAKLIAAAADYTAEAGRMRAARTALVDAAVALVERGEVSPEHGLSQLVAEVLDRRALLNVQEGRGP